MNGTKDPLNPFDGGEVKLFGLFLDRGKVRPSRKSGQYFADLNNITGTPETNQTQVAEGAHVEQVLWRNDSKVEVELVAIPAAGHGGRPDILRRRLPSQASVTVTLAASELVRLDQTPLRQSLKKDV